MVEGKREIRSSAATTASSKFNTSSPSKNTPHPRQFACPLVDVQSSSKSSGICAHTRAYTHAYKHGYIHTYTHAYCTHAPTPLTSSSSTLPSNHHHSTPPTTAAGSSCCTYTAIAEAITARRQHPPPTGGEPGGHRPPTPFPARLAQPFGSRSCPVQ